jgi:hypothetical protein
MKRGQTAWLITWEWCGSHATVEDQIAAILRPRLSERVVGEFVECLYLLHAFTPSELAYWSRRPKEYAYKSQWDRGVCSCGHNPRLQAETVHTWNISTDAASGLETISWVLPPRYRFNLGRNQVEQERGDLPQSTTRSITGPLSDREIGRRSRD